MATRKPATFDQLYPGRFLKAGTLNGKQATLTIKDADTEVLEGEDGKKIKAILSFEETEMQLVCCKTNGICIAAMFGKQIAAWIGKKVTLYVGSWNGEDCIRVWGSPDIEADMKVSVQLPRRKPIPMTLRRTVKGTPAPAAQETESAPTTSEPQA